MEPHDATLSWGDPTVKGLPRGGLVLPIGTVTFLLTDVEGSTRGWESSPDAMAQAIARHYELLDQAISAHGGVRPEEQGEGDSVVAAFSTSSDAVLAALHAQRALAGETWSTPTPLRVRMAIHTGEARLRNEGNYVGQAIIRTARLRAIAHGGQVLVSSATRDLAVDRLGTEVELVDLGRHRLKDLGRPEQVYQLVHPDLPSEFPPLVSLDSVPNNLPTELSTFLGRVDEIATIGRLVTGNRLVTLTGSGGAGKTRLAQRVAADVLTEFADGAWWVELVGVSDPARVAPTIAAALSETTGLGEPLELLSKRLAPRHLLLVLDNCEHLIEPIADVVHTLLTTCADLAILTTSRSALNLPGELTWRVPPLSLPAPTSVVALDALAQYDAVQLFLDRAVRSRQNFRLADDNAADVAAICQRLDGIPLAIELAAARCKVLSPAQIREGLDNALGLLGNGTNRVVRPRQQTIEASIDWSHSLLPESERVLLRRLSVFASPFTLDAAEGTVADELLDRGVVLDLLERLVDRSLVQMIDGRSESRFRLLETVRQFCRRKLSAANEADVLGQRHARWFAERAAGLWPLYHHRMVEFLDIADAEHDDMVIALEWLMLHGADDELCTTAVGFLPTFGVRHVREASAWLDRVIDRVTDVSLGVHGELLVRRAEIRFYAGRVEEAVADLTRAEQIGTAAGDEALLASEIGIRLIPMLFSDPKGSLPLIEELAQRAALVGDEHAQSEAVMYRAFAAFLVGDLVAARSHWVEAIEAIERTGCRRCLPTAQAVFGLTLMRSGRIDEAHRMITAARRSAALLDEGATNALIAAVALELALGVGDGSGELAAARALVTALVEQGEDFALGALLPTIGYAELAFGDVTGARTTLAPLLASPIGDVEATCSAALVELLGGDLDEARRLLHLGFELTTGDGDRYQRCRLHLADAALSERELRIDDAFAAAHHALDLATSGEYRLLAVLALEAVAAVALTAGDKTTAARLAGAAERRRHDLGFALRVRWQSSTVDPVEQESALAEGRATAWDDAVAFARRMRGERGRPSFGWDALTPTERQVVDAATDGLTNPQIATLLLMGRETVKTHLSNVYTKLSISNRSQLAALAAARDLR